MALTLRRVGLLATLAWLAVAPSAALRTLWRLPLGISSDPISAAANGTQYVANEANGVLFALRQHDGALVWSHDNSDVSPEATLAFAVAHPRVPGVLVCGYQMRSLTDPTVIVGRSVVDGSVLWQAPVNWTGETLLGSAFGHVRPLGADALLFPLKSWASWFTLNVSTGRVLWRYRVPQVPQFAINVAQSSNHFAILLAWPFDANANVSAGVEWRSEWVAVWNASAGGPPAANATTAPAPTGTAAVTPGFDRGMPMCNVSLGRSLTSLNDGFYFVGQVAVGDGLVVAQRYRYNASGMPTGTTLRFFAVRNGSCASATGPAFPNATALLTLPPPGGDAATGASTAVLVLTALCRRATSNSSHHGASLEPCSAPNINWQPDRRPDGWEIARVRAVQDGTGAAVTWRQFFPWRVTMGVTGSRLDTAPDPAILLYCGGHLAALHADSGEVWWTTGTTRVPISSALPPVLPIVTPGGSAPLASTWLVPNKQGWTVLAAAHGNPNATVAARTLARPVTALGAASNGRVLLVDVDSGALRMVEG